MTNMMVMMVMVIVVIMVMVIIVMVIIVMVIIVMVIMVMVIMVTQLSMFDSLLPVGSMTKMMGIRRSAQRIRILDE